MSKTITIRETRATYSVPIDEATLAEGPIIVERQGQPVAVIITPKEYQAFQEWRNGQAWQEEQLRPLEPEREAFQRLLPELLKTHRGRFVAIHDGQVIDTDTEKGALAQRVLAQSYGPVYIEEVREHPRIYELPSPEVVWRA
jgi:PHD/YefM family antitoxin component YafN of YafNO toxin-antitoxin module